MFTVENFISGLTNTTHGLSVSRHEGTFVLYRSRHDFEHDTDYQEKIAELQVSELEEVVSILSVEYHCADTILVKDDYLEVAVQPMDRNRPSPFMRSEHGVFETSDHNYNFVASKASKLYMVALLCLFSEHPGEYDIGPLRPMYLQAACTSLEELVDLYRIFTIKIISPTNHSISSFKKVLDSYIFNIAYNFNTALSLADFSIERRFCRGGTRRGGQLFPYKAYRHDLTKYYHQAISSNLPFMQYLAFYHVAEFFFQSISEDDAFEVISNFITRPAFSPYRQADIRQFYETIKKKMREQRDDGVWNEKNGLLLCLKKYIPDINVLKDAISRIDDAAIDYYKSTQVAFTDDGKVINFDDEDEKVYSCIRDRVYSTRNAIVHSKYGDRLRYEPFKHDKQLAKEVPLIRAIAEEIIISSAEIINYNFPNEG